MKKVERESNSQERLIALSYATLAAIALSVVLSLATHFLQMSRGSADLSRLRAEMVEIKQQMADRGELQAVRQSLLQLEKDVRKVSDTLKKGR